MRPLSAIAVVILILGGVQFYMSQRPTVVRQDADEEVQAGGEFSLDITLTFDAGPDAFALDVNDAPSLLVLFRGNELIRETELVSAGEVVTVEKIDNVVNGQNEFFVQASPADSDSLLARALRIRILRDERVVSETTLWSEPGETIHGTLLLEINHAGERKDGSDSL